MHLVKQLPAGLRALRHANFRMFISGQACTQIGMWLQLITTSWLMYRLSGSSFLLGVATFALQVPFLLVSPVAGVFLDRMEVRRVLLVTNAVVLAQAMAVLLLVATGAIQPWHLIVANLVLGIANACDAPARQTLVARLVDKPDLANAIALNAIMMNGARFIGPMVGGGLIAAIGELGSFALNGMLRIPVLGALARLRLADRDRPAAGGGDGGLASEFLAGARYAYGFLPSRNLLLLVAATSLSIQAYLPLMPWFAAERFAGGSDALGILLSAGGLGALTGMVYLALRPTVVGLFRLVGRTSALAGASLAAFSFTTDFWLGVALLYLTGMGAILTASASNTLLQTIVPDPLRSRVAALYLVSFLGVSPFGALASGWIAEHVGAPQAMMMCGAFTLAAAGLYVCGLPSLRRAIRPVYEQLGISTAR